MKDEREDRKRQEAIPRGCLEEGTLFLGVSLVHCSAQNLHRDQVTFGTENSVHRKNKPGNTWQALG